jgi:hexosaminidase
VFPYLYNPDDRTFKFLEDVLTETMAVFPSPYIHVGGDEAVKDQWKANPAIQQKIHDIGLKDEDALQSWFIARIGQFLTAHHRKLIGWDEILQGGSIPPDATITSWRGIAGGITAAKSGHVACAGSLFRQPAGGGPERTARPRANRNTWRCLCLRSHARRAGQ